MDECYPWQKLTWPMARWAKTRVIYIVHVSWITVLFLNSYSHDISHIQVLNWSMPSSKKHVYLEKKQWLNFNILHNPLYIFFSNNLANLKQEYLYLNNYRCYRLYLEIFKQAHCLFRNFQKFVQNIQIP
jgi:hypothetical protein